MIVALLLADCVTNARREYQVFGTLQCEGTSLWKPASVRRALLEAAAFIQNSDVAINIIVALIRLDTRQAIPDPASAKYPRADVAIRVC